MFPIQTIKARPLLTLLLIATLTSCSQEQPGETEQQDPSTQPPLGRLQQPVQPTAYDLRLAIDPREARFHGQVRISLEVDEPTQSLWLHGNKLAVERVVAQSNGESIEANYQQVADIGVARVTFDKPLPAGTAQLRFEYSAPFNTNLEGIYKVEAGGQAYAFSQFQATSARLAFPSFDEPSFKVPFDIQLEVAPEHKAVTTTPAQEETELDNGNRLIRFATTQPLPTYLVAFAVGPLEEVTGPPIPASDLRDRSVPLRGFAVQGKGEQLRFALQNTADILLVQEQYFGQPYPYQKLDLIAVPDFPAGAMENVGAITYREQYLLQSEETPLALQQRFLSVHAHELAHQWFGNLVTPEWWTDIWLNEAFATWMAAKTMHQLQPEAGYAQRQLNASLRAMASDRLASARQIRQPVTEHADIGAAFDGITYRKGGAVLAMLEGFVGEDAFKQGIQRFMESHRFDVADAQDFVRAIAASRPDLPDGQIEAAFFSFLEQPGTPLVKMNWQCDDAGTATVSLEQSRYLPLGSDGEQQQTWVLPFCLAYPQNDGRQTHCELIRQASAQIELSSDQCPDVIVPNADASGYYRWSLPAERWRTLLSSPALNERERLAAATSFKGGFNAGELTASDYVELLPLLLQTDNVQVITAPKSTLEWISDEVLQPPQRSRFRQWVKELYQPVYQPVRLGQALDDAEQIRLRTAALSFLALLAEDDDVRATLADLAANYAGYDNGGELDPSALDANIRLVALRVGVQELGRDFSDLLLRHFHNSDNAVLREHILRALATSNDDGFIRSLRDMAVSETIRDNEAEHILEPLMANPRTRDETWNWLRDNMDAVIARYPGWFQGGVIRLAAGFCDMDRHREIESEWSAKFSQLGSGPRALANTLESIQLCAALKAHHAADIRQAFAAPDGSPDR